jgi:hypothetical protein
MNCDRAHLVVLPLETTTACAIAVILGAWLVTPRRP